MTTSHNVLTADNKIAPSTDAKETYVSIPRNYKKERGLDWAESSWTRWIYVVFWSWLTPVLNLGRKRQLTDDDLFDLSPHDECSRLLKKFETVWEESESKYEHVDTWKVIIKTFWKHYLLLGLVYFPFTGIRIAQPLLLKQIVLHISDSNSPAYVGYLYAIGIGLSSFVQAVMQHQLFFRTGRVGTDVRIALSSIIYKRLLSLPTRATMKTSTGQLINLISNDASKFEELSMSFHQIWASPMEALIVFGLIWNEIGIPALFGYGVLLLLVPVLAVFSRQFGKYRRNTIQWTDKRVKVINEILVGCQIVKMYRWEEALEGVVYNARNNEFKSIRKASRFRAIGLGLYFSLLPSVSLVTFGGSWLMGKQLVAANVFTVLALFGIIRNPLTRSIPLIIEKLSESMVASQRINQFMNLSRQFRAKTLEAHSSSDRSHPPGSMIMNKATFTWGSTQSAELIDIDLNVSSGSLVGIIGTIGSGKSSLLAAVLDEMSLVNGASKVYGNIAYVSQTPWIFSGTIRENILFCKSFDKDKYERVLKSSCLITDLRTFSAGDLTVIGEKGVNLSGGQKVRVSLARALYTEADIYLFDDPLAAVDLTVARNIFKECISNEGILKNKTRLLVTHQIQFLPEFDHCIVFNNGKIEKQGLFSELLTIDKIKQSYENQQCHTNESKGTYKRHDSNVNDDDDYNSTNPSKTIDENSIIKEETSVVGTVSRDVWLKLFISGYGWIGLVLLVFLLLLGEGVYDGTNKWLSVWASKSKEEQRKTHYPYIYLGLVIGTWIISLVRADYFFHLILRGTSALHNSMFKGVLYSSLRFYEGNPVGRILNRFSKDQQTIDELLPVAFFDTLQILIMVLGSIVIIGMANPWVLLIFIPIVPIFLWLTRFYLKTSRVIKRLESVTRSPVYALFSSSLSGLTTIRAFKMENDFVNLFIDKINANSRALFMFTYANRWFAVRLELLVCCITLSTAIISVALRNSLDASAVALGLSYCISLLGIFQWGVRQSAETEMHMTSAERIHEYAGIPPESNFYEGESQPPANWPAEGGIDFDNYKLKYRSELEPVLKGINLKIVPRNKIGIIGRTGAGKSSIFQALFRLVDRSVTDGKILIDGIDINRISLNDLRSIFNIIPQSPVLFSNTLRYNLDPFQHCTDEQLWNALEAVQLKTKIEKLEDKLNIQIAEYGSNFSVGECQLICVARAILKQSKILLIDEATAHVDTKTDGLIQQVLREKFKNQTIITIAHRLNTVMDSDKIVVMQHGIVAEYGTPAEILMKQKELLADLNDKNEVSTISRL